MPPADPQADEQFMRRAIRLAMNGRGRVEPNPMVGCVLAKNGHVIGEGFHAQFGGPHAEPTALANCTESPEGATAYVTLEPCCHTNKKTPPCAPRLIEAKVGRVVIGCLDPNPAVNGNGVAMLREAGIQVDGPLLEATAKQLIAPFLGNELRRPYVTLKWAETADGFVAGTGGARLQITGRPAGRMVHELRARCDAILVGINTVLADDPLLSVRGVEQPKPLIRVVLDRGLRLPLDNQLVRSAGGKDALFVGTTTQTAMRQADRVRELENKGAMVWKWDRLVTVLHDLSHMVGLTHLLVEPGPTLARTFVDQGLADRIWLFRSPDRIDADGAPRAVPVPEAWVQAGRLDVGGDTLTEYLNPASPVFFAAEPSADFVLARESAGQ